MCSRDNTDVGARELCTKLVKSSRTNALLGTVNVEGGDRWVMRGLFCEIGKLHALLAARAAGDA